LVILFSDLLASLRLFDPFVCRSRLGGICGHVIAHWLGRGQREVNCLTRSLFPSPLFGQEVLTSFSLHFSCLPCPQGESISRPGPRTTFCNSILRPGDSILMQLEVLCFLSPASRQESPLQNYKLLESSVCVAINTELENICSGIYLCAATLFALSNRQMDPTRKRQMEAQIKPTRNCRQAGRQENTLRLFRLNAQHSLKFNK